MRSRFALLLVTLVLLSACRRSIHPLAICGEGENLVVWSLLEDYAAFVESDGQRDTEIRKLRLGEDGVAVIEATAGDLTQP